MTVATAPAARAARAAARAARMRAAAPAAPGGVQLPTTPLQPPAAFTTLVSRVLREAAADARQFARTHDPSERWLIDRFALQKMKWPPRGKEQAAELAQLHGIAATRTAEQTATARWYSEHGLTTAWDIYLADYTRTVGPRQARAATKLLHDTLDVVHHVTQVAKAAAGRTRPFDVDPSLPIVLDKPGGSPSYPSGHTSAAFAAAIVLGHLMPHRREEFLDVAMQASYARMYGGVHFPSDIAAGARLAGTVAYYMCGISDVVPHGRGGRRRAASGAAAAA